MSCVETSHALQDLVDRLFNEFIYCIAPIKDFKCFLFFGARVLVKVKASFLLFVGSTRSKSCYVPAILFFLS